MKKDAWVACHVHHHFAAFSLVGVHNMEHIAGWRLEPFQAGKIAIARQESDARSLLLIPEVREDMPRKPLRLKGDRQVENDDEVLSKAHIVHHRPMRQRNVGPSFSTASGVHHNITDRRPTSLISEGDGFPRRGIMLWMGSETAFKRAAEVRAGDALQVVVQFDRQRTALHESVDVAADGQHVGVHPTFPALTWAWNRWPVQGHDSVRAQCEAAAIPFRTPAAQA